MVGKAPSTTPSFHLALLSSCACKIFKSFVREIFDRPFVFSKTIMVASNLSGTERFSHKS